MQTFNFNEEYLSQISNLIIIDQYLSAIYNIQPTHKSYNLLILVEN